MSVMISAKGRFTTRISEEANALRLYFGTATTFKRKMKGGTQNNSEEVTEAPFCGNLIDCGLPASVETVWQVESLPQSQNVFRRYGPASQVESITCMPQG